MLQTGIPHVRFDKRAVGNTTALYDWAIVFKGPGKYAYEDRPIPEINNPDDIRIQIQGVGIKGLVLPCGKTRPLKSLHWSDSSRGFKFP